MDEKKFNIGDRVRLESPYGPDDSNEGVEGIVVGYCTSRDDTPGIFVKICDGYKWSVPSRQIIDWLDYKWWKLVKSGGEYCCESLL